ncbi:MAG: YifB family Mg chelatase-like AAA ATPase [Bacillota bacterium]|nr:YifB family Mg chelatase-like AAA ATPase [Bacillota bacterium]
MLTKIITASLWGIDADLVTVETDAHPGLPALNIVGLADITIKEAKDRIRPAVMNSGFRFPGNRITVNLSPAATRKEGSHFDLPVALGLLLLQEGAPAENAPGWGVLGELSLDGQVLPVTGALPMAIGMRKSGIKKIMVPEGNAEEVSIVKDISVYPVESLREAYMIYTGQVYAGRIARRDTASRKTCGKSEPDYADVAGQENVKRAVTIAAAGAHGLLMMGSPGVGKTMIASRMPGIMPDLDYEGALTLTQIYSVAGRLSEKKQIIRGRPFIAPHTTITKAGLMGGGLKPKPGAVSLAHEGILFLDEFGEFDGKLLDMLRQPMEEGKIAISRGGRNAVFPCSFMLVAASNPCKCGYLGDPKHECTCTPGQIDSYRSRFSGPLMDRIDLHVKVEAVEERDLGRKTKGLSTPEMKEMVAGARVLQRKRQKARLNGELEPAELKKYCPLGEEERKFMEKAYSSLGLSMRVYHKIIKVSRTIADLAGESEISVSHIAEALQYRGLESIYHR